MIECIRSIAHQRLVKSHILQSQRRYSMVSFPIITPQIASSPDPPKKLEVSFTNNLCPDGSRTRNDTP